MARRHFQQAAVALETAYATPGANFTNLRLAEPIDWGVERNLFERPSAGTRGRLPSAPGKHEIRARVVMEAYPNMIFPFLLCAFGECVSALVDVSAYTHTFSMLNNEAYPSLTLRVYEGQEQDVAWGRELAGGRVDSLEFIFNEEVFRVAADILFQDMDGIADLAAQLVHDGVDVDPFIRDMLDIQLATTDGGLPGSDATIEEFSCTLTNAMRSLHTFNGEVHPSAVIPDGFRTLSGAFQKKCANDNLLDLLIGTAVATPGQQLGPNVYDLPINANATHTTLAGAAVKYHELNLDLNHCEYFEARVMDQGARRVYTVGYRCAETGTSDSGCVLTNAEQFGAAGVTAAEKAGIPSWT